MKRFFLLLTIALIFISTNFTYADDYYEGKVISQYCKVFESANTKSKVLRTLTKGVSVIITEDRGEFYHIRVNGNPGWALKKDIEILKDKLVITPNKQTDEPEEYQEPAVVNDDEPVVQVIPYYNNYKELTYGLKGGLSMSKLTGKYFNSSDSKYRIGLNFGGFLHYRFSEMFGFMTELNYVNRGGKGVDDNNQDVTVKFDYIELPYY